MPAITIRNIPEDVHRGLKALAARHGRSAEAEVRELISAAVNPEGRPRLGSAISAIWQDLHLTDDEQATFDAAMEAARDRTPANPMDLGE